MRAALLRLLRHVMPEVSSNQIAPFFPVLSCHLCCAMTHIHDDIQLDSLALLGETILFLGRSSESLLTSINPVHTGTKEYPRK